ncbi:hypothetical protein DICPUDRAFT_160291 [Dictyostelium purpureum]|uniref:N-acetyltransferase domain-containing protein n=1 Tax=Dictyostelium purpureum TaxID=5786 RepID=F1A630_DICPU|nr:uncharacterized protein DICPUDRAFT_160291 [Dictyostelium purpureum]EGC28347.1 hypothetical protein DICPUDRAFT_160291 [Dictyostelium purpureum]|eukprot:XP_003295124.1 hypothetical protein DICPUDRAFT_160291 [Dictyostelium purpureum]
MDYFNNNNNNNNIEIIDYNQCYHQDLKKLSYEWLEKYVSVEPLDEEILNNPKEMILDGGGFIFMSKYNDEIVGTVSLIRIDDETFELAKLAVTEKYQGLKLGQRLMQRCINKAKETNTKKVILYTNLKLSAAIGLYKKFGFVEIPLNNNKYIESDLKMELQLN